MLIGYSAIDTLLNTYLHEHFPDLSAEMGTDFSYSYANNVITYALVCPARDIDEFRKVCEVIDNGIDADIFILSFFHEIGHYETWDELDETDIFESQLMKKQGRPFYYYAPDEFHATVWALKYIRTHKAEIANLWKHLSQSIANFYRLNGILDNN